MSMLFAYMAGGDGGGWVRSFKMFFQRDQNFFLLAVCVCVGGGGGGGSGSVPLLP